MRVPHCVMMLIVPFAAAAAAPALAADKPIFTLADPRGDDHGDGSLLYPQRDDLQPGELDIVSFSALPDKNGTIFEVAFARPVRRPERRAIDEIGTSLDSLARLGFYNFNVDIYVDTDRVPASGRTATLPGRRATIDEACAWEKAICLTPRPFVARQVLQALREREARQDLKRRVSHATDEDERLVDAEVTRDIEASVFFPTLVWVIGNRARFFVPASFLGGVAKDTWAYVVADSVADLQQRVDLAAVTGLGAKAAPALMIVPVQPGRGAGFVGGGREDDALQPPLLDVIVPPGLKQEDVLKDYDLRVERPVKLPGVVPLEGKK